MVIFADFTTKAEKTSLLPRGKKARENEGWSEPNIGTVFISLRGRLQRGE